MATISQDEVRVSSALQDLKFELQPVPAHKMGSPAVLKVTPATLNYLKSKTVTVASDGTITVE
jgi:hypothetical protein